MSDGVIYAMGPKDEILSKLVAPSSSTTEDERSSANGQRNEITQAETLTENIVNSIVVADKGYDSNSFVASLENRKCKAVIPQRGIEKCRETTTNIFIKSGI
ncbi:hypothetical protein TNCT_70131 [Trichonephila clavata]|uniref:Transposase IS4-like domain-containing protein n=1 Tax=Trichonephila clavata TaxID=2740835 RepID=A0A8X6LSS8_TRICU|nr:hypothetical protein TNCT_70131 [Trichonephila clavata]